ncbi:MAG TPA: hypothetical protein VGG74_28865 [Kofleriaceae bacterium]
MSAYRRAGFLRYAAIQLVVLAAIAMVCYAGGTWRDPFAPHYELAHNFLSDLGATRAFSGRANYASAIPFAIALVTVGAALIAFAWCWRDVAFDRGRARALGIASALAGTASGAAFAGIALAPIDRALHLHVDLVIAAFALLFVYVACLAVLMWRNGVGHFVPNAIYIVLVAAYVAMVVAGPRIDAEHGLVAQVVGQKLVVGGSMIYVVFLTTAIRRRLAVTG